MNSIGNRNAMNEQAKIGLLRPLAVWRIVCAVAALALLGGCASVESAKLPDVQKQGEFTYGELIYELEQVFGPNRIQYELELYESANVRRYSTYRPEDYANVARWLLSFSPDWTEGYLCVQFAQAMRLGFSFAAAKDEWSSRTRTPPAIGWFGVRQIHTWAGVSGETDPRHALNIYVAGPRGGMSCWIMEPQNGTRVRVAWQGENGEWVFDREAYPNWKYIEFVRLEL